MRIPLAVDLESRDGGVGKDAKVLNGVIEPRGQDIPPILRKRPGNADLGLVKAGTAQLLTIWNGVKAILGDYLNAGTISTIVSGPTQTNLSPTNAGLQFQAQATSNVVATPLLFFKNRTQAWTVNRTGTVTAVTYASNMGAGTYTLISLTRTSGTAIATLAEDVFNVGDTVTIAGATPAGYNGAQTITAVTAGTASVDIPLISLTRSGTTATATTAAAHGLTNGGTYTISGSNYTAYNGSKTITVTSPTTFTYTVTVTGAGPISDLPITISRSGTTATATTVNGVHNLSNSTITIYGADQSEYNGSHAITVTSTTQFTFTVAYLGTALSGTWNTSDKAGTVALSGGNLVATITPGGANSSAAVRGTVGKSSGVWYWEITITSDYLTTTIGVANASMPLSDYIGQDANSWGYASGALYHSGYLSSAASFTNGDVIGVKLDMDAGTVTFYKNGTSQGGSSGLTGTIFAAVANSGTGTAVTTANFGASSFVSPVSPATGSIVVVHSDPLSPSDGAAVVTKAAVNPTFAFTIGGSPATPATGTITAASNGGTVPGIAYVNGYFCVMDLNGMIWNSALDNPATAGWTALNFTPAQLENGAGRAIAKSLNYVVALKEWSTEFYYDAQTGQVGSPLRPVETAFTKVGCASGDSVAELDGGLLWIAQTKQESSRSVYFMIGMQEQRVSTPDVDRVLNADTLATVYAFGAKMDGHSFYILTLVASNITLAYDLASKTWVQWSSLTLGSSKSVSSITRVGTIGTVTTGSSHGLSDGDPVKITGADQDAFNGIFQIRRVSDTVFTVTLPVTSTPTATGTILAFPYTESYFKFTKATNYQGTTLLLHESDGHLYQMLPTRYQDAGIPINLFARTSHLDGGTTDPKVMSELVIVGDTVSDIAMVRHSNNDSQTLSAYRPVDLSTKVPRLRRLGSFERRSLEFRYVGNNPLCIEALEPEISQ